MVILFWLLTTFSALALEVIKPAYEKDIVLRIVAVEPDSFETYLLTNHNGRVMTLVCARNVVYDNNPKAFIEYRNFYNEIAGNFTIESNQVCKDIGRFIEQSHFAVNHQKPFEFVLNRKTGQVSKIVYPKIDPLADEGDEEDLLTPLNKGLF
jgi:hypothetical protein